MSANEFTHDATTDPILLLPPQRIMVKRPGHSPASNVVSKVMFNGITGP
jgi:hypothetical protein